jgi:hypothetical protein
MRPTVAVPANARRAMVARLTKRIATDAEFRKLFRSTPRVACDAVGIPFEFVRHMLVDDGCNEPAGGSTATSIDARRTA